MINVAKAILMIVFEFRFFIMIVCLEVFWEFLFLEVLFIGCWFTMWILGILIED